MIVIDRHDTTPYYRQIYRQVVEGMRTGVYRAGDRLPSIRSFAMELGVSRNTVEQAYTMLTSEGYVRSRKGSGYYILPLETPSALRRDDDAAAVERSEKARRETEMESASMRFDLSCDAFDPDVFPYYRWAQLSREAMLDAGREDACRAMDPRGIPELREQLAHSLARERGMAVDSAQIAVFPSASAALSSAASLFGKASGHVLMCELVRPDVPAAFRAAGLDLLPVSDGMFADWMATDSHSGEELLYIAFLECLSPGKPIGLAERERMIAWAKGTESFILEDDRCDGIHPGTSRTPPMQTLDGSRVVTLGSLAGLLGPSMGIAYLVLPPLLMVRWLDAGGPGSCQVSWLHQKTVASFMAQDLWHSRLRRLQTDLHRKHHQLFETLKLALGESMEVVSGGDGEPVLVRARDDRTDADLVRLAGSCGVRIVSIARFRMDGAPVGGGFVLVCASGISDQDIVPAVSALAQAWLR